MMEVCSEPMWAVRSSQEVQEEREILTKRSNQCLRRFAKPSLLQMPVPKASSLYLFLPLHLPLVHPQTISSRFSSSHLPNPVRTDHIRQVGMGNKGQNELSTDIGKRCGEGRKREGN